MKNENTAKKVLFAIRTVDVTLVSQFFENEFDYLVCFTLEQAEEILKSENIGLVICNVRFNSGHMFELLSLVRTYPSTFTVPYYLLLAEDAKYSYAIVEGIRRAAKVKGASGFINLSELVYDFGKEKTRLKLKEGICIILNQEGGNLSARLPSYPDSMIGRDPRL